MALHSLYQSSRRFVLGAFALTAALLLPVVAGAQQDGTRCPEPPARLTTEKIEGLMKSAKDSGFLWKIEKNGLTGYLYGTIHVNKLEWMLPGPTVRNAMQESQVYAFEVDVLDPKVQSQMADPANFGIKKFALPEAMKKRMEAFGQKVCAPAGAFAEMHPMIQFVTLTLFDARFEGAEAAYGSEMIIGSLVKAGGKSVVGLETPAQQMHMLLDGNPAELTEMIAGGLSDYEAGKGRTVTARLLNTWSTGNLTDLADYEKWCECAKSKADRAFYKRINDDRNPGLAKGIDKLIQEGKPVFAAVGSLHMTGPKALPKLLKDMGYKVERVAMAAGSNETDVKQPPAK